MSGQLDYWLPVTPHTPSLPFTPPLASLSSLRPSWAAKGDRGSKKQNIKSQSFNLSYWGAIVASNFLFRIMPRLPNSSVSARSILRYYLLSPGTPSCCSRRSPITGHKSNILVLTSSTMLPMGPNRPADSPVLALWRRRRARKLCPILNFAICWNLLDWGGPRAPSLVWRTIWSRALMASQSPAGDKRALVGHRLT